MTAEGGDMPGRGADQRAGRPVPVASTGGLAKLVGRHRELDRLGGLVTSGHGLVLITGDAGIGKSRLGRETLRERGHLLVLHGTCSPVPDSQPLLPVMDALEPADPTSLGLVLSALDQVPRAFRESLRALLPHTYGRGSPVPAELPGRDALFAACAKLLSSLSRTRRTVLVVEDIHWADQDTIDFLSYLVARQPQDLIVLATCRTSQRSATGQVRDWLRHLRDQPAVSEIRLSALNRDGVQQQLRALVPGASEATVNQLWRRSEGNPFLTEQLAASLLSDGQIRVPRRVADFLHERVEACSVEAARMMTVLALAGGPIALDPLAELLAVPQHDCQATVQELLDAMLATTGGGRVGPRHALLGEAWLMYPADSASELEGRLAELLEGSGDDALAPEAAAHYRGAGRPRDELRMVRRAAARARSLGSEAESARWRKRSLVLRAQLATEVDRDRTGGSRVPVQRDSDTPVGGSTRPRARPG